MVAVIVVASVLGILLAGLIIKGPTPTTATSVSSIPSSFPDVKNDTTYSNFLNTNALDPTQSVSIGGSQNNSPFNPVGP